MSEHLSKDPITQLRCAIAEYQKAKAAYEGNASMGWDIESYRAEAWRLAFEWRNDFGDTPNRNCRCKSCRDDCAAYDEGMRLIREKLQS